MSIIYVTEDGSEIGSNKNQISVRGRDGEVTSVPFETVEGITILGKSQMTTACIQNCLSHGIPVSFLSKGGKYYGRLISTSHTKASLQRLQAAVYNTDFSIELARKIVQAKVGNQLVLLRRYARNKAVDIKEDEKGIIINLNKVSVANSLPRIMGYEGQCAKHYFSGLAKCIDPVFVFEGRNRRPPKDEFNSLISLGYSVLMNEVYNEIEMKGLNPYFGFMHQDAEKHPTLASDLMEEWRAVIVDSVTMSLINGHELHKEDFVIGVDQGCYLTKHGLKVYMSKLQQKMQTHTKYLVYSDEAVTFRTAISMQIGKLVEALENKDVERYQPISIR